MLYAHFERNILFTKCQANPTKFFYQDENQIGILEYASLSKKE